MAFVKGQSGNPSGRPKHKLADGRSLNELAREHTQAAFQALVEVAMNPVSSDGARVSAANSILDRGWGKAPQPIGGSDDLPAIQHAFDVSGLKPETLRDIASMKLAGE